MENTIRKGHVITVPMKASQIASGTVAVLKNLDEYTLCTVQHLTAEGEWSIEWSHVNGPVPPNGVLCTLMAWDTESDMKWPIKLNQWKASLKSGEINSLVFVEFEVNPAKFVEGHYNQICSFCNASFVGYKRQPVCRECCDTFSTARIITDKKPTVKKSKTKSYPESTILSAFVAGSIGGQDWDNWKKNNL